MGGEMEGLIPVVWSSGRIGTPDVYFDRLTPAHPTGLPPVVMIHGGAHTGACYLLTADGRPGWAHRFAAAGYPVVIPDWPGCGRSGAVPQDRLSGTLVCDGLAKLIESLGEPVIVLTHSMSGAFGWKLLERCGARIARMVAVAPAPPGNIQPPAEVVEETSDHLVVHGTTNYLLPKHQAFVASRDFARSKLVGTGTRFPERCLDGYVASLHPIAPTLLHQRLNVSGRQLRVEDPSALAGRSVLIVTGTDDVDHAREADGRIADWLRSCGARVDYVFLGDAGVHGNGHMLMLEENSDEIADLILSRLGRLAEVSGPHDAAGRAPGPSQ